MTYDMFMAVLSARMNKARATLKTKGTEYAREDRLSNFKKVAAFRNIPPEEALFGMVMKHIAALDDFVTDLGTGVVQPYDRWDEKIGDIICYMILLDALVQDRETDTERVTITMGARDLLREERLNLESALSTIKSEQGKVCDDYENCKHESCRSSYTSWAIADKALKTTKS